MKRTLVIGASENPVRYSNMAILRLLEHQHEVIALGIKPGSVAGIPIVTERTTFENIDTVTLYVGPKRQPEYYQYIIDLNPKRVIFNPGTENPEFYRLLEGNGIEAEVACTLVLLASQQY